MIDVVFVASQQFTFFGMCINEFDLFVMLLCEPFGGCVKFRCVIFHPLRITQRAVVFLVFRMLLIKNIAVLLAIFPLPTKFCFFSDSALVLLFAAIFTLGTGFTLPQVKLGEGFLCLTSCANLQRDKPFALE